MHFTATPLETQTASLLQAVHSDWMPLSLTPPMSASIKTPTTIASQTDLASTRLPQEIFSTKSTSMQPTTTTKLDPVPPPQHLKTGHSSLSQKSSGISHMPLKENIIIPTGQPTVLGTNVPCWHNRELRLTGSTWTESGCSDCICKVNVIVHKYWIVLCCNSSLFLSLLRELMQPWCHHSPIWVTFHITVALPL